MVKINKEAYIPLLPYDLGYEETILQLIKSLDCLDKVVERVYEHVRDNMHAQKLEISKLNGKLNDITDKVHRLSNSKKSVQIYSSSKYPAAHCQKDYQYSYDFDVRSDIVENIQVAHNLCATRDPSNKLKFYTVNNENIISMNKDLCKAKGLGNLPNDVKYINSLLLFNSNENLYKNYVLSNPYETKVTTSKQVENIENKNRPVFTLPLDDSENQFEYSYTPVYEEVPTIDVPADLPDLPGIAGDLQCFKEEKIIADEPDVCKPSGVVDLPSFDELNNSQNEVFSNDSSSTTPLEITISSEPEQLSTFINVPTQNNVNHSEDVYSLVKNDQTVNKTFNDSINTHSVLMDEIRNAGGLKKAKLRSVSDRITNEEGVPAEGGLMADLHKKLAMRRQGISGNNKQNDSGLGGVIYRMATTMLPPDSQSDSEPDKDDDTENDWDD